MDHELWLTDGRFPERFLLALGFPIRYLTWRSQETFGKTIISAAFMQFQFVRFHRTLDAEKIRLLYGIFIRASHRSIKTAAHLTPMRCLCSQHVKRVSTLVTYQFQAIHAEGLLFHSPRDVTACAGHPIS